MVYMVCLLYSECLETMLALCYEQTKIFIRVHNLQFMDIRFSFTVRKTGLNDSFMDWTYPVIKFKSVIKSQ